MIKIKTKDLQRLKELTAERNKCLMELEMWAKVADQGIDPDTVDVFGFDPQLLSRQEKRKYQDQLPPYKRERLPNGHYKCPLYNYVKLKDGIKVELKPTIDVL